MRLIDADSYSEKMEERTKNCFRWRDSAISEGAIDSIYRAYGAIEAFSEALHILDGMPSIEAVPVVRCKDYSHWGICHRGDDWYCANGTPINTASDFYDDKGKRLNNSPTYKSIYQADREQSDQESDTGRVK